MGAVFFDASTAGYRTPGHPEAPERVTRTAERLKAAGHTLELPRLRASAEDVALVHARGHFAAVRAGDFLDPDTAHFPGIERIALTSLSGALSAAQAAQAGAPAFSLMRPPGHHAGKERVSGFCYFNNIAVACARALKDAAGPVAILDIDVHHGDGTEELMTRREGVLFCSLHQVPLYPGTGLKSHDNVVNVSIPPFTGEGPYIKEAEKALQTLLDFKPALLAVSAGFDTYKEDPIAQLKLEKSSYRKLGGLLAQTKLKRFAVLEGGYAEDLPVLVEKFLDGFFS